MQLFNPDIDVKVPAGHSSQLSDPALENVPGEQTRQLVLSDLLYCPAGQGVHDAALSPEKCPGRHDEQDRDPESEYWPATHGSQEI